MGRYSNLRSPKEQLGFELEHRLQQAVLDWGAVAGRLRQSNRVWPVGFRSLSDQPIDDQLGLDSAVTARWRAGCHAGAPDPGGAQLALSNSHVRPLSQRVLR